MPGTATATRRRHERARWARSWSCTACAKTAASSRSRSASARWTDGQVLTMSAIRDMTARRRAEATFRGLLEAAPDAMVIADRRGRIHPGQRPDRGTLWLYAGMSCSDRPLSSSSPVRFHGPACGASQWLCAWPRDHGRWAPSLYLYGLRKDGTEFPVEISLSPLETEAGMLTIAAIRDVTEKKAAAQRTRLLDRERAEREKAEAEVHARNDLLAEIRLARTPISSNGLWSVRLSFRAANRSSRRSATRSPTTSARRSGDRRLRQVLLEEHAAPLRRRGQRYLGLVRESAQHMGQLIDGLLSFSRLGRQALNDGAVNAADARGQALRELQRIARRGARSPSRTCPAREADLQSYRAGARQPARQRRQVHGPAIDVARDRGRVHRRDRRTAYFVRDNGAGFDMALRRKLFGLPAAAPAEEFPGTGHRAGDRAAHRPSPRRPDLGRGRAQRRAPRSFSPSPEAPPHEPSVIVEILLVEDNPNDVELALRALARHNMNNRIHVVRDGAEALDFLFCEAPYAARDLQTRPESHPARPEAAEDRRARGAAAIKADPRDPKIPVVMLTSSKRSRDIVESYRWGRTATSSSRSSSSICPRSAGDGHVLAAAESAADAVIGVRCCMDRSSTPRRHQGEPVEV